MAFSTSCLQARNNEYYNSEQDIINTDKNDNSTEAKEENKDLLSEKDDSESTLPDLHFLELKDEAVTSNIDIKQEIEASEDITHESSSKIAKKRPAQKKLKSLPPRQKKKRKCRDIIDEILVEEIMVPDFFNVISGNSTTLPTSTKTDKNVEKNVEANNYNIKRLRESCSESDVNISNENMKKTKDVDSETVKRNKDVCEYMKRNKSTKSEGQISNSGSDIDSMTQHNSVTFNSITTKIKSSLGAGGRKDLFRKGRNESKPKTLYSQLLINKRHKDDDALDLFFSSMKASVRQMTPYMQHVAKTQIFNVISTLEKQNVNELNS